MKEIHRIGAQDLNQSTKSVTTGVLSTLVEKGKLTTSLGCSKALLVKKKAKNKTRRRKTKRKAI